MPGVEVNSFPGHLTFPTVIGKVFAHSWLDNQKCAAGSLIFTTLQKQLSGATFDLLAVGK